MIERLKTLILERSFRYSDTPTFRLVCGEMSQFYFNCKPTTLSPEGQYLIGKLVYDLIKERQVDAIGGLTLGADPIACAVANESFRQGKPVEAFVVRKKIKDHGIVAKIEGNVKPGDRVILVDDVVTTGKSTIEAIEAARENALHVIGVVALIDRQEMNGRENIEKCAKPFHAVLTVTDILKDFKRRNL